MSSPHEQPVDPSRIAEMAEERAWTTPVSGAVATWEDLEPYLSRIDPLEADVLEMQHLGMTQESIGRYFGMTQPGVSYRLARARRKVQMLRCLPEEADLSSLAAWATEKRIPGARCLAEFLRRGWSGQRAGEAVGMTQHRARAAVVRCLMTVRSAGTPHSSTAARVLRAVRRRWSSRLSSARNFPAKVEPHWEIPAGYVPPPRVIAAWKAMVEEWESRR